MGVTVEDQFKIQNLTKCNCKILFKYISYPIVLDPNYNFILLTYSSIKSSTLATILVPVLTVGTRHQYRSGHCRSGLSSLNELARDLKTNLLAGH